MILVGCGEDEDDNGNSTNTTGQDTGTLQHLEICVEYTAPQVDLPARQLPPAVLQIQPDGSLTTQGQQPLAGATDKMWDVGQTIRVKMMGGTPVVRSRVREIAQEWTRYANLRFNFVDPDELAEIRITFDPKRGTGSVLGREALGGLLFDTPTMNYSRLTDTASWQLFRRHVLHEFGHALGLVHEHQSPASGIKWNKEAVYKYFKETEGWDRAKVDEQVLDKYTSKEITNYSTFDPDSIMVYYIPSDLTLDGTSVNWNTDLSSTDIEYIRRWYPKPPSPTNAVGLLRTGDDCDEIRFHAEYAVAAPDHVEFRLSPAPGVRWWKAIEVPRGNGYQRFQMQDGKSSGGAIPVSEIDKSRPIRFWKAKELGRKVRLGYTWDVLPALLGGTRLSFRWNRDRC